MSDAPAQAFLDWLALTPEERAARLKLLRDLNQRGLADEYETRLRAMEREKTDGA